ncbi:hypothetical protein M9Y10_001456 [Tritrichomonas musculus]|uniref:beta-galactosidase n=1 Tax=Tritrichomonas musculus TaxID=1915356 RepID=A0ABR2L722_9EUKA
MHTRAISRFLRLLSFRVGFMKEEITKVEWNGKQHSVLLFNGKPVIYKGISIHVHKEKTGYYVKDDIRKEDFEILKKNNFKEFCFSHYPNSRQMYHLCD